MDTVVSNPFFHDWILDKFDIAVSIQKKYELMLTDRHYFVTQFVNYS